MIGLNVVIGLVSIYLLYSLLATAIQELLATRFGFRQKLLERALFRMLEDGNMFKHRFSSIKDLFSKSAVNDEKGKNVLKSFYSHPLIKGLGEDAYSSKPSYITKETFSKVIVDLLRGEEVQQAEEISPLIEKSIEEGKLAWNNAPIAKDTLRNFRLMWVDTRRDADAFRKLLEQWFDDTMVRCSGWYRKDTQYILLAIGLFMAILFNVDSIAIVGKLQNDTKLREEVVMRANNYLEAHPSLQQDRLNDLGNANSATYGKLYRTTRKALADSIVRAQSDSLINREKELTHKADSLINAAIAKSNGILGLGWSDVKLAEQKPADEGFVGKKPKESLEWIGDAFGVIGKLLFMFVGWLITAIAISFGAAFWFNIAKRFRK